MEVRSRAVPRARRDDGNRQQQATMPRKRKRSDGHPGVPPCAWTHSDHCATISHPDSAAAGCTGLRSTRSAVGGRMQSVLARSTRDEIEMPRYDESPPRSARCSRRRPGDDGALCGYIVAWTRSGNGSRAPDRGRRHAVGADLCSLAFCVFFQPRTTGRYRLGSRLRPGDEDPVGNARSAAAWCAATRRLSVFRAGMRRRPRMPTRPCRHRSHLLINERRRARTRREALPKWRIVRRSDAAARIARKDERGGACTDRKQAP